MVYLWTVKHHIVEKQYLCIHLRLAPYTTVTSYISIYLLV